MFQLAVAGSNIGNIGTTVVVPQVWNGNFQDLQIDVEISEISGNNLWKFPKFPY